MSKTESIFKSNFDRITLLRNLGLRSGRRRAQEGGPEGQARPEVGRGHERGRRRNGRRRRT